MNKIVAAFDGLRFSEATLHTAISLAGHRRAHLVGVLLHEFYQPAYLFAESMMRKSPGGSDIIEALKKEDEKTYRESVTRFTEACSGAGVEYTVHCQKDTALQELVQETIFADLLIIDPGDSFSSLEAAAPSWYVHSLLKDACCPVLATTTKDCIPSRPVFLYDGSTSSVHAMKMFTYLFPSLGDAEVDILTIKPDTLNLHVPHHRLIHEWVKRHYPHARFRTFSGPVSQLLPLLEEKNSDCVIVTGAYDRSRFSMLLHPSLADDLIAKVNAPIFIAHS